MKTISIDRNELVRCMKQCFTFGAYSVTIIRYLLGSKPKLGSIPGVGFKNADCSGFVRWLVAGATRGQITMPMGSYWQQEWCKSQGFKKTDYANCGLNDNRLRVAFINGGGSKIGHVWLICNSMTVESWGGHGAGRRPWNTSVLIKNVDATYVLTDILP